MKIYRCGCFQIDCCTWFIVKYYKGETMFALNSCLRIVCIRVGCSVFGQSKREVDWVTFFTMDQAQSEKLTQT